MGSTWALFIYIFYCYLVVTFAISYPTMILWNALLPDICHLPIISNWQAWGLCLLARLIFGAETVHIPGMKKLWADIS